MVTYREYVTHRTPPRELAREIVARSVSAQRNDVGVTAREKIDAIYLSPDAFARRTDEASIAEQMGDVFAAAGFPRPIPADDDRVGGWMLMYQMLDAGEWLLTDNCIELIRTLPNLVRDPARVEDVEKMDGDDPADAARYGLKSRYGARAAACPARACRSTRASPRASRPPTPPSAPSRRAKRSSKNRAARSRSRFSAVAGSTDTPLRAFQVSIGSRRPGWACRFYRPYRFRAMITMKLRALWQRISTSRYTRALEAEVMLLRAENRALLNSILGIAGVPPILVPDISNAQAGRRSASRPAPDPAKVAAKDPAPDSATAARGPSPSIAVPMRRRSWQQINRMLEFESARKKREA